MSPHFFHFHNRFALHMESKYGRKARACCVSFIYESTKHFILNNIAFRKCTNDSSSDMLEERRTFAEQVLRDEEGAGASSSGSARGGGSGGGGGGHTGHGDGSEALER